MASTGEGQVGERKQRTSITLKDIARLAGVSVGTTSKVINRQGNVGEAGGRGGGSGRPAGGDGRGHVLSGIILISLSRWVHGGPHLRQSIFVRNISKKR